jgi:hypothetical protein
MIERKYYAMQHKINQQSLMKENNDAEIGDHERMHTQTY